MDTLFLKKWQIKTKLKLAVPLLGIISKQLSQILIRVYLSNNLSHLLRKDPATYSTNWPDPYGKGIVSGDGVGHSSFMWYCRGTLFSPECSLMII
jgi:hypothetical protein